MMKLKFSCVLDNKPIFKVQTYILVNSLIELAKVKPIDIYVHTLKKEEDELYTWLTNKGVNIIEIKPFHSENPYCNKLQQLATFENKIDFDYVMLLDCDIAVIDLKELNLKEEVYAKVVDFPNPPFSILNNIYQKAGFKITETNTSFALNNENITDWNNCNGGVYILSQKALKQIAPKWIEYANWSIDNKALFTEAYSKHADQVGFALALHSLNINTTHLGLEWNYPTHVSATILPNIKPNIIHFHNCLNEHMQLKIVGLFKVDEQIKKLNDLISEKLSEELNNSLFWNLRYNLFPELGSGVGSRGEVLSYKIDLIKNLTYGFDNKGIIDVGCGDLELMKNFEFENYLGIDVSSEALKISKEKKPNWKFTNDSISSNLIKSAELIFCFDVLIHQSKKEDFEALVKDIVEKSKNRIVIGAYNSKPEYSSTITHFYNGILDEVLKYNKFNEISIVAKYRDVSVIVGTKHLKTHSRDIDSQILNKAFLQVSRPDLLQYIVDVSRYNFGFYTSHYPRVFEYTWLLEQFENTNKLSVLDIGSGVCPLPICLSEKGMEVTTVDSHSKIRDKKDILDWNEWGFLDYAQIDKNIKSYNLDFLKFESNQLYDCIYSISVIEHIPQASRKKILNKCSVLLKKGGKLLLTIDLEPNTINLWNKSEDKLVDIPNKHGTVNSLKKELRANGFEILNENIQKNIDDSRTDVLYLVAELRRKSLFSKLLNKFSL